MDASLIRTRPATGWALLGASVALSVVGAFVLLFGIAPTGPTLVEEILVLAGVAGIAGIVGVVIPLDPTTRTTRPDADRQETLEVAAAAVAATPARTLAGVADLTDLAATYSRTGQVHSARAHRNLPAVEQMSTEAAAIATGVSRGLAQVASTRTPQRAHLRAVPTPDPARVYDWAVQGS